MNNSNRDSLCIVCEVFRATKMGFLCDSCANDPFKVEMLRAKLVNKKDLFNLRRTYSLTLREIKNINTKDFWDKKLKHKSEGINDPMTEDRINIINRKVRQIKGKLLDIGFGRGELEKKLDSCSNIDIYGIDISNFAVKRAKANLRGKFLQGSIRNIPFRDDNFNVVLALEVLEHIPPSKTFEALGELNRMLEPKGILIVSVPLNEGLEDLIKRGKNPNGHVRVYTSLLIEAELKMAGFRIEEIKFLYAFKNLYFLKKILQKTILQKCWQPNDMIVFAHKP